MSETQEQPDPTPDPGPGDTDHAADPEPSPRASLPDSATLTSEPAVEPAPVDDVDEDTPARVAVRFHNPDSPLEEFSLPGYMSPTPAIVRDGVVFAVDGLYAADVNGDRFEHLGEYDPAEHSTNAELTKAELGDKLGLEEAEVDGSLKADLVERADTYDKANPQPPGSAGDVTEEVPNE